MLSDFLPLGAPTANDGRRIEVSDEKNINRDRGGDNNGINVRNTGREEGKEKVNSHGTGYLAIERLQRASS